MWRALTWMCDDPVRKRSTELWMVTRPLPLLCLTSDTWCLDPEVRRKLLMCWRLAGSGGGSGDTQEGGSHLRQDHPKRKEYALKCFSLFFGIWPRGNCLTWTSGTSEPPRASTLHERSIFSYVWTPSVAEQIRDPAALVQNASGVRHTPTPPLNSTKPGYSTSLTTCGVKWACSVF